MEIPDDFNVGFCYLQANTIDCCTIWVFDAKWTEYSSPFGLFSLVRFCFV